MSLIIEKMISNLRVHGLVGNELWASNGYSIFCSRDLGDNWSLLGKVPASISEQVLVKTRLGARLLRRWIHQIIPFSHNFVLIMCAHTFYISNRQLSFFVKSNIHVKAFQLLDHNILILNDKIYYGEYFPNIFRKEVNIYCSNDGIDWEKIYSFRPEVIKHIHLMQYDPFSNSIWFSSGDEDRECLLGYFDSDFSSMSIAMENTQNARSLEIIFTRNNVYWGTDNPSGQSCLMSLNRENNEIKNLCEFSGPIFNLKKIRDDYIILTDVEGGKSKCNNRAHLWFSNDIGGYNWIDVLSYEKDYLPYIFGFGRLLFGGTASDRIFLTGLGLNGIDNKTIVLKYLQ